MENPSKRYNNLTKGERDALYSLRDDSTIIMKDCNEGSVVVVRDKEDYLKEAYKEPWDREVYEEVPNDPNVLIYTIMKVLERIRFCGKLSSETLNYFLFMIQNPPSFIFYLKFISDYTMYLADQ